MKLLKKILKIFLLLILLAVFAFLGYYFAVTKEISLSPEKLTINENVTKIYDADGRCVANASTLVSQEIAPLEAIPEHTRYAFVAVEDRRFYSHDGFDLKRTAKALFENLKALSFKEGGSTISQQLVKNTHLSQKKTIKRKLQEIKLTFDLEKAYSKDEILEKYLNTIYFGGSCFGISSAARFYFDKTPSELTIGESALLAGLVKSPNNYSPFKNAKKCENRRAIVLNAMLKTKRITKEQFELAKKVPLPSSPNAKKGNKSYFSAVFDELEALAEAHDFSLGGKISVYTYLNEDLQAFIEKRAREVDCDAVISILDVASNGFSAYYKTAAIEKRPPASLIKPLAVYAPAIEENLIAPATLSLDEKINYSGYAPQNHDGKYHGYVSARTALSRSYNVPAVKILNSLGVKKSVEYLEKLNLPVPQTDKSLSLALGGMQKGFSLNELVGAYSAFSSHGLFSPSAFVDRVYIDDKLIYSRILSQNRVFSESTAYLVTDMLKTAVKDGTAKKLRLLDMDVAAKTGTNGVDGKNLDAYALSYTPSSVIGVWLGNASNAPIEYTGGGRPCDILYKINEKMQKITLSHKDGVERFEKPDDVAEINLDKISYETAQRLVLADENAPKEYLFREIFQKTLIPTQKDQRFSSPSIPFPSIEISDGLVTIDFQAAVPSIYRIVVKKHYYASHNCYITHSTLYEGEYPTTLTDAIESEKRYFYSITPYYKEIAGKSLYSPAISTSSSNSPIFPDIPPDITKKDWWNY